MEWAKQGLRVVTLGVALCTLGCAAFSDRNEEHEVLSSMNLLPTNGGEETPVAPSEGATVCKAVSSVTVTTSEKQSIQSNSGWSTTGKVKASAVAADATTITIAGDGATLAFVVQKKDDKTFVVCSVSYALAGATTAKHAGESHAAVAAGAFAVANGSLMVDQFNVQSGDATKVVNAGSYLFAFKKEAEAAKAAAVLLGAKAEATNDLVTVEGTYYTEQLEAAAK